MLWCAKVDKHEVCSPYDGGLPVIPAFNPILYIPCFIPTTLFATHTSIHLDLADADSHLADSHPTLTHPPNLSNRNNRPMPLPTVGFSAIFYSHKQ